jgi:release factor glutamine methyltransferase
MKVSQVIFRYKEALKDSYHEGEISQIIYLVFEHVKNFSKIDLVTRKDEVVSESEEKQLDDILSQLIKNKPIQYILGYSWFYGIKIIVNSAVLIPRQETEELVDWIIKDEGKRPKDEIQILDICTGSGCIAIALKKNLPGARVSALDVSTEALAVAEINAAANHQNIQFIQADILQKELTGRKLSYDIIVSNPPYVLESEKKEMQKKELDYEPHLAMFVKHEDPLIFYSHIADLAAGNLTAGGKLYFEINEKKGREVTELLMDKGFSDVTIKHDLNGKHRIIRAVKLQHER